MPHLLRSSSTGHLLRNADKHLRIKHPGYTFTKIQTANYYAYATDYFEINYEDGDYDWWALYAAEEQMLSTAISQMVSWPGGMSQIQAGWGSSGSNIYPVWGSAQAAGFVYEVEAVGGAPFGSPTCDLTVEISKGISGFPGTPYCKIGTGSTIPTGNPGSWNGAWTRTATSTIEGFSLGRYVWVSAWFTYTSGISDPSPEAHAQFSLSTPSIRY